MSRRRWIWVGSILFVAFILLFVSKDKPFQKVPKVMKPEDSLLHEVPIAQKGLDWNNDGKQEKLSIVMTEGELRVDRNPGPFEGEFYVGKFAAELSDSNGKVLQRFDLTSTFQQELSFRKGTFELALDDYNDDNYWDFTIGQYASSNGYVYNLYTVRLDGISIVGNEIFTAASDYSIYFLKDSPISFLNRYYDNSRGMIEAAYEWDGDVFKKKGEISVEEKQSEELRKALRLTVTLNDYGFNLLYNDSYYMNFEEIIDEGDKLAIPFIFSEGPDNSTSLRRVIGLLDVESLNSLSSTVITDTTVHNYYNVSSALQVFGLLNDNQIVYSNVTNSDGAQVYRIDTLDLSTSKIETIIMGAPSVSGEQDRFARNWFSPELKRLVFNKYHEGSLEVIDLKERSLKKFHNKYQHPWPFFMTVPSPDGTIFWHEGHTFQLIDLEENVLASVPYPAGMIDYPTWIWSEDSRYSAFYYTFDDNRKHVIDSVEIDNIAPQGIRIFSREGKEVANVKSDPRTDEYVEIAGWLPERNSVLLRYFHLDRKPGRNENFPILNSTYKLYDLGKRTFTGLKTVKEVSELDEPHLIASAIPYMHHFMADLGSKFIWEAPYQSPLQDYPIVSPSDVLYIIRNDEEKAQAEIARFDKANHSWEKRTLPFNLHSPRFVGENWLMGGELVFVDLRKLFTE